MKQCPNCNRTYSNLYGVSSPQLAAKALLTLLLICRSLLREKFIDEFAFCLADGTLLSAPYDSEKTQLINEPLRRQLQATETLPSNKSYDENEEPAANAARSSGSRRRWDKESFLQEVAKHPDRQVAESLRELYQRSKEIADKIDFGSGVRRSSFNVKFSHINPTKSFYTVFSDGSMELNFAWLQYDKKSAVVAEKLGQELKQLPGFIIPDDFRGRYITIRPEQWSPQINAFIKIVQALTSEIEKR
jgi:hypothetical protein